MHGFIDTNSENKLVLCVCQSFCPKRIRLGIKETSGDILNFSFDMFLWGIYIFEEVMSIE